MKNNPGGSEPSDGKGAKKRRDLRSPESRWPALNCLDNHRLCWPLGSGSTSTPIKSVEKGIQLPAAEQWPHVKKDFAFAKVKKVPSYPYWLW